MNYTVVYQLKTDQRITVVDAAISYVNLTGLRMNTSYTITVSAINEFGEGQQSDDIIVTTAYKASESDLFLINYLNPLLQLSGLQITCNITCKSTNLTYMIECLRCKKQYIGETKRMLRERLKNTDKPLTILTTPMPQQQFLHTSTFPVILLKT